jgi:5'/3'-nucleotidase SurE
MRNVLVVNDDGIDAKGIRMLIEALTPLADVYVVAPATEQSGKSQSITFQRTITAEKRDIKGAAAAYAIDGTPTDCAKWGIGFFEREDLKLDYVISGINLGYNAGLAAYYSGTISAAREAALNGYKSIALSAGSHQAEEFDYLLSMLPMLFEMSDKLSPGVILNVNVPNLPADQIKGYMILEAAPFGYGEKYIFAKAGEVFKIRETAGVASFSDFARGGAVESDEYQMVGVPGKRGDEIRYDMDANALGYAAISPIPTSLSDRVSLAKLQNAYAEDMLLTVIVDAQIDVLDELDKGDEIALRISSLAHCMDRMDIPMLLTECYGKGELIEGVKEHCSRAELAERMEPDAWFSSDLGKYTSLIEAGRILIAGAETHIALLQTALGFVERGYEVTVLEDCCASADPKEHRRAVKELKDAGCRITSFETEIMRLANDASQPVRTSVERIIRANRPL